MNEILAQLQKFFPNMENFEAQVMKYKREIERLEKSNATLSKKAKDGEKASITRTLDHNKLQSDYNNLRRFVDTLPEEIKHQAKLSQKSKERGHGAYDLK